MSGPVLVTGAAGFFGLAIVRALTRAGFEVLATDRAAEPAWRPGTDARRIGYVARDLEHEAVGDLVERSGTLVYAAALTPKDDRSSETAERLLTVNLEGFLGALRAAGRAASCARIVFVSSSAVYDHSVDAVVTEADARGDGSLYAAAKLAAEVVGRRYAQDAGIGFCAVRPTSLIGPGETERPSRPRVTPFARLVRAARAGTPVRVVRGESRCDWLAVDDAAEAVAALCAASGEAGAPAGVTGPFGGQSYSLSAGVVRPFADFVDAARRVAGLRTDDGAELLIDGGSDLPGRIPNDRLVAATGWRPRSEPEAVVRALVDDLDRSLTGLSSSHSVNS
jgi:nucleoside-diphosphate-sugar epimerase